MEDAKIIALFWERNEQAVKETDAAYGGKLYGLSNRILNNREDAEESVSDTYMERLFRRRYLITLYSSLLPLSFSTMFLVVPFQEIVMHFLTPLAGFYSILYSVKGAKIICLFLEGNLRCPLLIFGI